MTASIFIGAFLKEGERPTVFPTLIFQREPHPDLFQRCGRYQFEFGRKVRAVTGVELFQHYNVCCINSDESIFLSASSTR